MFKRTTFILIALIALLGITACAKATAEEPNVYTKQVVFVHDWSEPKEPNGMVRIMKEMQEREEKKAQEEQEAIEKYEYEDDSYYYEEYTPSCTPSDNGDGFKQQGVRYHDGRTETYYSSQVAYHKDTAQWTVDDEGYYRDDEGRYVVAASDVPEGTEIETSKGTGIVKDSGCDEGVTDFYVNF